MRQLTKLTRHWTYSLRLKLYKSIKSDFWGWGLSAWPPMTHRDWYGQFSRRQNETQYPDPGALTKRGEGTVDWGTVASNCSTGNYLSNINKMIISKSLKLRILSSTSVSNRIILPSDSGIWDPHFVIVSFERMIIDSRWTFKPRAHMKQTYFKMTSSGTSKTTAIALCGNHTAIDKRLDSTSHDWHCRHRRHARSLCHLWNTAVAMPPWSADHNIETRHISFKNASRMRKWPTQGDGRPLRVVGF